MQNGAELLLGNNPKRETVDSRLTDEEIDALQALHDRIKAVAIRNPIVENIPVPPPSWTMNLDILTVDIGTVGLITIHVQNMSCPSMNGPHHLGTNGDQRLQVPPTRGAVYSGMTAAAALLQQNASLSTHGQDQWMKDRLAAELSKLQVIMLRQSIAAASRAECFYCDFGRLTYIVCVLCRPRRSCRPSRLRRRRRRGWRRWRRQRTCRRRRRTSLSSARCWTMTMTMMTTTSEL